MTAASVEQRSTQGAAVIVGASGGIGRALVEHLMLRGGHRRVYALSRSGAPPQDGACGGWIDLGSEDSVAAAAGAVDGPVTLVIVASGRLHGEGVSPERSLADVDPGALAHSFQVNAIGPSLVAKHLFPKLARGRRVVFAVLSARVGSIQDNRLGGWYGYRASKAALNMLMRTAAVELARTRPLSICVALHPGTVDTGLSRPFQRHVPPGQLQTAAASAERLLDVLDALEPKDSGGFFAYDGSPIAF